MQGQPGLHGESETLSQNKNRWTQTDRQTEFAYLPALDRPGRHDFGSVHLSPPGTRMSLNSKFPLKITCEILCCEYGVYRLMIKRSLGVVQVSDGERLVDIRGMTSEVLYCDEQL